MVAVTNSIAEPKLYKKRWFVLLLYVVVSPTSTMQWTEYTMVANEISNYYNVSYEAVNWSNLVTLVGYVVFAFPCSYIIDKYGVRKSLLLTTFGTCVAAWIKATATSPDDFWMVILGQLVLAIPQACLINLPPKIASSWFGPNEISMANSVGVSSIQIGSAIGFILPPLLVKKETVEKDLSAIGLGIAAICTMSLIIVTIFFPSDPSVSPSYAEMELKSDVNYVKSIKRISKNVPFLFSVISSGLNIAVYCVLSTLLNQIIIKYYPDSAEDAGWIGVLIVALGFLGAVIAGVILDKFHIYRSLSLILDVCLVLSLIAFAFTLSINIIFPYILCTIAGSLILIKWPIGYDIAVETSYPEPSSLSIGLINIFGQSISIGFTYFYSYLFYDVHDFWANIFLSAICFVGLLFMACSKFDLKRHLVNIKLTTNICVEKY